MSALIRGETALVATMIEAAVLPAPPLPPVERTDAVAAFGAWLAAAPGPNRALLRGLLRTLGLKLRRMPAADRASFLQTPTGRTAPGVQMLMRIAAHCYYGDEGVMRALGYDAREVAARGLAVRRAEGRP